MAVALLVLLAACTPATTPQAHTPPTTPWAVRVARSIDRTALADAGLDLPAGANVFAARIYDGDDEPAYAFYEAGGGAFASNFFPASAIKVLAALGALDYAHSLGFDGGAVVDGEYRLRDYYDAALRWSSNEDYSALVRIAGVDRLNREYLPSIGYPNTRIQEPYGAGEQVTFSPEMVLSEGDREMVVPERQGDEDYGCAGGNCTTLFDVADALRRVVLDRELPAAERFNLAPADLDGMRDALAGAEGFIAPGVEEALGPDAHLFTKPGYVPDLDCVETAVVVDPVRDHRFLLALSAPDDGSCEELATMARDVLRVIDGCADGFAVRSDGSRVAVVDGRQQGPPLPDGPLASDCHLR